MDENSNVSEEQMDYMDAMSGHNCTCGIEMTNGERDIWGYCNMCYNHGEHQR